MRAQVSLIPSESKKLIAKALAEMAEVKRVVASGVVVMHPSSSTLFLVEELLGRTPETEVWMCGAITPRAACGDDAVKVWMTTHPEARGKGGPEAFPFSWVFEKGKLTQGEKKNLVNRIKGSTSMEEASKGADLVIEAIIEKMVLKKKVFRKVDVSAPSHAILASNTSYLNISEMASATKRPEQVVGIHFFNPVGAMRLVEVIRAEKRG